MVRDHVAELSRIVRIFFASRNDFVTTVYLQLVPSVKINSNWNTTPESVEVKHVVMLEQAASSGIPIKTGRFLC